MYLSAISIGCAIPDNSFDASVHSVFQSALNLRLHASGQLLTLVTVNGADLPQGIRVDTPKDFSFEIFSVGEQATCRDEILCMDSLTIRLRGALRWTCDLPALEFDSTNPAVSTAWSFVWDVLNQQQITSNADIITEDLLHESKHSAVSQKAGRAMRELLEATRRYDVSRAESSIPALVGLGSGLTPSGDDLIVGYIAGLWCAVRGQGERIQFAKNFGDAILRHSSQTNEISRAYLYHAAHGQVSSLLANLAEAICMGWDSNRLLKSAESIMSLGHTSGMDAVTGLLIGLTAWSDPKGR